MLKSFLDNAPKATALLSFFVLMLTVFHDWGYFWIIGSKFQSLQTPYDYVANSITWLPLSLALLTSYVAVMQILTKRINPRSRDDFDSTPHHLIQQRQNEHFKILSVVGFGLTIFSGASWYILKSPFDAMFGNSTLVIGYCSIISVWLPRANSRSRSSPMLLFVLLFALAPLIVGMSFAGGLVEAVAALSFNTNVYGLKQKDAPDKHVLLLRSLDKGVLTYDLTSNQTAFTRWDSLIGIDHTAFLLLNHGGFCDATKHICSPPEAP